MVVTTASPTLSRPLTDTPATSETTTTTAAPSSQHSLSDVPSQSPSSNSDLYIVGRGNEVIPIVISSWCAVVVIATGAIAIASKMQQQSVLEDDNPSLDGDIEAATSKAREGPIIDEESELSGMAVDKSVPAKETLEKQAVSSAFQGVEKTPKTPSASMIDTSVDKKSANVTSSAIDGNFNSLEVNAPTKVEIDASEVFDGKNDATTSKNKQEGTGSIYLSPELAAVTATAALPKTAVEVTQEIELESNTVTSTSTSSSRPSHLFLKQAVERGDWNAVGQAAAIMGRESAYLGGSAHETLYLEKEDRIEQLDELIAEGDWIGVLTLAGQYEAMDRDLAVPDAETHTDLGDRDEETESVCSNENNTEASAPPFLLKQAIENEDWEAVGQAAAIMNSAVAANTNESSAPTLDTYSRQQSLYLEKEDRIKQLDGLIASGDWLSVLIVAGQYEAMDQDFGSKP